MHSWKGFQERTQNSSLMPTAALIPQRCLSQTSLLIIAPNWNFISSFLRPRQEIMRLNWLYILVPLTLTQVPGSNPAGSELKWRAPRDLASNARQNRRVVEINRTCKREQRNQYSVAKSSKEYKQKVWSNQIKEQISCNGSKIHLQNNPGGYLEGFA